MVGRREDLLDTTGLGDATGVEHGYPVTGVRHDAEVMRDEQNRYAKFFRADYARGPTSGPESLHPAQWSVHQR